MPRFIERLAKLERRLPAPGNLPTIFIVPTDEPDRSQVLADIQRRRAAGWNVVAIGPDADPLAALVEAASP